MSDWTKLELVAPKLKDASDRKEMARFIAELQDQGKYTFDVTSTIPSYSDESGTPLIYASGTTRRFYVRIGDQWNYFGFMDSDGTILVDGEIEIGSYFKANDTDGMWLGHTNFSSAAFRVNLSGDLVASSATITGTITAESGTIGGFTIGSSALTAGGGSNTVGLQPSLYPFYAGSPYPSIAPFNVDVHGRITCSDINISGGAITSAVITANTVQTSADPTVNRVKMDGDGLIGFDDTLGLTFKIPTDGTSPVFSNGQIMSATIIDTTIVSNDFKTSSELPYLGLDDSGLYYTEAQAGSKYGSGVQYGDGTKYGTGIAFYVGNSGKPVLSVEKERSYADVHLYNRSSEPSGAATIGDLCCVSATLRLCTTAGTPGTYTELGPGDMLYPASTAQGDLLYLSAASTLARLAKDTNSTRYLSNQGASNNPSWNQVNLTNGVTGELPNANLATITTASKVNTSSLTGTTYLPDNTVDTTALKTSTGEVSKAGDGWSTETLPGGEYGFYPQIKMSNTTGTYEVEILNPSGNNGMTSYTTVIGLEGATGETIYAQQRYVTASGEDLWVFILVNKITKEIESVYQAHDHPAYGSGGDFNDRPHPFLNYDSEIYDIILLNKTTCKTLKKKSKELNKSIATLINENYKDKIDFSKELSYEPLHSGKYIADKKTGERLDGVPLGNINDYIQVKEMVKNIPSYIKVRRLRGLT